MQYRLLTWETEITWQYDAACLGITSRTGEDPFFHPESPPKSGRGKPSRVKQAKDFCSVCPVTAECLQFALDHDCTGIWGGLTERERKRLK